MGVKGFSREEEQGFGTPCDGLTQRQVLQLLKEPQESRITPPEAFLVCKNSAPKIATNLGELKRTYGAVPPATPSPYFKVEDNPDTLFILTGGEIYCLEIKRDMVIFRVVDTDGNWSNSIARPAERFFEVLINKVPVNLFKLPELIIDLFPALRQYGLEQK